ncbi:MAG: type II toxin-antitoxin system death-on-curing family toxin [Deltaproteobacteria bacterium]|jgi:death-on-curing protein|nr:type II toxin-antitoxin system death-on-curing family toxin [Deltaproteobacteria bacterium]
MTRDHLTIADVLAIHAMLLKRYGGADGTRDPGALEAAVFRPQSGYYSDIVQETCALLESLLINHPFVDGNKRTAFAACDVFLRINGHCITAGRERLYELVLRWIALASNERFQEMEDDLRPLVMAA